MIDFCILTWLTAFIGLSKFKKTQVAVFPVQVPGNAFQSCFQQGRPHDIQVSTQVIDHLYRCFQFPFTEIRAVGNGIRKDFMKAAAHQETGDFFLHGAAAHDLFQPKERYGYLREFLYDHIRRCA